MSDLRTQYPTEPMVRSMDDNYWGTDLTAFGANKAVFRSNKISQIPDQINLNLDQKSTKNGANISSQFRDQISTDIRSKVNRNRNKY